MNSIVNFEENILKMFEYDKLEHQKMNSSSHHSYSNTKENREWSGKLEVQSLKKITY